MSKVDWTCDLGNGGCGIRAGIWFQTISCFSLHTKSMEDMSPKMEVDSDRVPMSISAPATGINLMLQLWRTPTVSVLLVWTLALNISSKYSKWHLEGSCRENCSCASHGRAPQQRFNTYDTTTTYLSHPSYDTLQHLPTCIHDLCICMYH